MGAQAITAHADNRAACRQAPSIGVASTHRHQRRAIHAAGVRAVRRARATRRVPRRSAAHHAFVAARGVSDADGSSHRRRYAGVGAREAAADGACVVSVVVVEQRARWCQCRVRGAVHGTPREARVAAHVRLRAGSVAAADAAVTRASVHIRAREAVRHMCITHHSTRHHTRRFVSAAWWLPRVAARAAAVQTSAPHGTIHHTHHCMVIGS